MMIFLSHVHLFHATVKVLIVSLYSASLDIDECSTTNHGCEMCINNEGSFDCQCRIGYNRSSDNGTCEGKSVRMYVHGGRLLFSSYELEYSSY